MPALGGTDVRGMQERGALETYVDEGRLHARQHPVDPTLVDIPNQTPLRSALDEDLLQHAVFDDRNPGLLRRDVDQDLSAHWALNHLIVRQFNPDVSRRRAEALALREFRSRRCPRALGSLLACATIDTAGVALELPRAFGVSNVVN